MDEVRFWIRSMIIVVILTIWEIGHAYIGNGFNQLPVVSFCEMMLPYVSLCFFIYMVIRGIGYPLSHWKETKLKSLLPTLICVAIFIFTFYLYHTLANVSGDLFFNLNYNALHHVIESIEEQNYPDNLPSVYRLPEQYQYLSVYNGTIIVDKTDHRTNILFQPANSRESIEYSSTGKSYYKEMFKSHHCKVIRKKQHWFRIVG